MMFEYTDLRTVHVSPIMRAIIKLFGTRYTGVDVSNGIKTTVYMYGFRGTNYLLDKPKQEPT